MSLSSTWIERIQSLPVLPQVAMRVAERMQSPTATTEEIASLIRSDAGLTAKLLKLANSSYYSVPGGVSDVHKALQFLGFNTVAQLVLTSSVFGAFKTQGTREFPLSGFWIHSFAVGLLSEITARSLQVANSSDCFVGGLMHDIGKLVLMEIDPAQLSKITIHAREHQQGFLASEEALGAVTHVQLGSALAQYWKLPAAISGAIIGHHREKPESIEATIVSWANQWVHARDLGQSGSFEKREPTCDLISKSQEARIEAAFLKEFEKAEAILHGH